MTINKVFSEYDFSITDLRTFGGYRDAPIDRDWLSYGDLDLVRESDLTGDRDLFYVPGLASGSDYSGWSVTVANHKFLLEEFGDNPHVHDVYGGHGTYAIAFNISQISDQELADVLIEHFEGLEDYLVLCDDTVNEVEREAEENAWVDWLGRWDFPQALPDAINTYLESQAQACFDVALALGTLPMMQSVSGKLIAKSAWCNVSRIESVEGNDSFDSPLLSLFWELCEKSNTYFENETGNTATIRLEDICKGKYILESEHWQALVKSGAVEFKGE